MTLNETAFQAANFCAPGDTSSDCETAAQQDPALARAALEAMHDHVVQAAHVKHAGLARIHALDLEITPYTKINWPALNGQDPAAARALWRQFSKLKFARDQTARALQNHQQQLALGLQRARAKEIEEGRRRLQQDVEGWSPELAQRIVMAGKAHGFSDSEIHSVTDPRMIVVLNKARLFDDTHAQEAAAKRQTAAQTVKPAMEVGAQAPAANDPSRLSTAEWMRWRANQLRKRK